MKKLKLMVLLVIIFFIVVVGIVFLLRFYNDNKYGNEDLSTYEYYQNVTDLNLYPKTIEGVDLKYIDEGALQGFHMIPHDKVYKGVIVCYGGSEGGPNFEEAERLAKEGYETLAVFMFGMPNQPKTLTRIPLEQFEDVLKYVKENIKNTHPITVLGASKGAEYALNLATKYEEISNLVLIAPSAYTFSGLDFNDYGSSWTYNNEELPYVDIKKSSFPVLVKNMLLPMLTKSPAQFKETYASAVEQDAEHEAKVIPVENIKANILMIAGEDDQMWGSYDMASLIKEKNKNAILESYKNAGHIFIGNGVLNSPDMRIKIGGNLEGNTKANTESKKAIDDFLEKYHTK